MKMKLAAWCSVLTLGIGCFTAKVAASSIPVDASPLNVKAAYFQKDLLEKHWLDGLYVSIVPSPAEGEKLTHTVDEPGNVIHSGVWTGRCLAGVGYQYAATRDSWA